MKSLLTAFFVGHDGLVQVLGWVRFDIDWPDVELLVQACQSSFLSKQNAVIVRTILRPLPPERKHRRRALNKLLTTSLNYTQSLNPIRLVYLTNLSPFLSLAKSSSLKPPPPQPHLSRSPASN
ncbi:MAG: hypothetical protein Q9218_002732 [Villophora microphyllina]